jgi:hypothetical protein
MSTFLKRPARTPKSATPSQCRSGVATVSWFRGLTVVVAVLVVATACGETTSPDPAAEVAGEVSAAAEVSDSCPDGLRVIEDAEATKDLRCANLTDASLTGAFLSDADLTGAFLDGTTLTGAFLTGAFLTGATLIDATLTGAFLDGTTLTSADLTDANLTGAFLTRVDLTGATMTDAKLTGAIWADTTCPDGSDSDTNGRNSCP